MIPPLRSLGMDCNHDQWGCNAIEWGETELRGEKTGLAHNGVTQLHGGQRKRRAGGRMEKEKDEYKQRRPSAWGGESETQNSRAESKCIEACAWKKWKTCRQRLREFPGCQPCSMRKVFHTFFRKRETRIRGYIVCVGFDFQLSEPGENFILSSLRV